MTAVRTISTLAAYELRIVLRSRWVAAYAIVFAALAFAVSYFGLAVIEFTGLQQFDRTSVSLLNLVLYLVPLATMLMPVQSLRAEGGATDQLFAEPVSRGEVLLGKLAGLLGAHVAAAVIGFGFTGALVAVRLGTEGLSSYIVLVGFTLLIGAVFLSLSTLFTVLSGRGPRAYAVVLVAWFVLVLVFDLLVIGVSFMLPEGWANRLAIAGVFLNPVDAARVGALLAISGKELFGPAGAQLVRTLGSVSSAIALLVSALVLWAALPLAAALAVIRRQDITSREP
jgi:Cu-processing system permease protein